MHLIEIVIGFENIGKVGREKFGKFMYSNFSVKVGKYGTYKIIQLIISNNHRKKINY